MATKKCVICGKEFQPQRSNSVTCLSYECKRRRNIQKTREWTLEHMSRKREINRDHMRRKRTVTVEVGLGFKAEGYAERQKAKLLAMAGKVEVRK